MVVCVSDVSDGAACPVETPCVGRDACGSTRSLDPFERVHGAASGMARDTSTDAGRGMATASRERVRGIHALLDGALGRRASVRPSRERSGRGSRVLGAAAPNKRAASYATPACHNLVTASPAVYQAFLVKYQVNRVTGALPVYDMRDRPAGRARTRAGGLKGRRFCASARATGRS